MVSIQKKQETHKIIFYIAIVFRIEIVSTTECLQELKGELLQNNQKVKGNDLLADRIVERQSNFTADVHQSEKGDNNQMTAYHEYAAMKHQHADTRKKQDSQQKQKGNNKLIIVIVCVSFAILLVSAIVYILQFKTTGPYSANNDNKSNVNDVNSVSPDHFYTRHFHHDSPVPTAPSGTKPEPLSKNQTIKTSSYSHNSPPPPAPTAGAPPPKDNAKNRKNNASASPDPKMPRHLSTILPTHVSIGAGPTLRPTSASPSASPSNSGYCKDALPYAISSQQDVTKKYYKWYGKVGSYINGRTYDVGHFIERHVAENGQCTKQQIDQGKSVFYDWNQVKKAFAQSGLNKCPVDDKTTFTYDFTTRIASASNYIKGIDCRTGRVRTYPAVFILYRRAIQKPRPTQSEYLGSNKLTIWTFYPRN